MHVHGGTLAAVAKATAPLNDDDRSRPWREFGMFRSDGTPEATTIVGSDGFLSARVTVKQASAISGVVKRADLLAFTKRDAVHIDTVGGGARRTHRISAEERAAQVDLSRADGTGDELREPYPDGPENALNQHPGGRPSFRCDPKLLRRALTVLITADVAGVEIHVAPAAAGSGMIFLRGQDDAGNLVEVCLGIPRTAERKDGTTGETVEYEEATPLFPGAEKPPKADPTTDEHGDEEPDDEA